MPASRRQQIGFVEAHGTGTAVGDPIEAHALADALCGNRPADAPLPIGSIKTNLGHLETAAGVAGLVKAMLVLKHGQIPPSLHFKNAESAYRFREAQTARPDRDWSHSRTATGERIAGVNSFGFGGANAHVILAEPPPHRPHRNLPTVPANRPWPIDAFRPFGKIAAGFRAKLEQLDQGARERQWQFTRPAGSDLHARRPTKSPPAPPYARRQSIGPN